MGRDLQSAAELLRRQAGLVSTESRVNLPVDIERIAEARGLRIVGSERKGPYRLPPRRSGQIRINERILLVHSKLLDDQAKETELLEVIAHEVAHDALHADLLAQRPLPFGPMDFRKLALGRLSFGVSVADMCEREAIYLGALLLVPLAELRAELAPSIGDYLRKTSCGTSYREIAKCAASDYQRSAVDAVARTFHIPQRVSKIALDYWGALTAPPTGWWKGIGSFGEQPDICL